MIETPGGKSFAAKREEAIAHSRGEERIGHTQVIGAPLTWLNVVCLDAPIVAVSWLWLFASSIGVQPAAGGTAALFLSAWFIYLADRLSDCLSLASDAPTSLRQRFCLEHRNAWLVLLIAVAVVDVGVIATSLDLRHVAIGAIVGGCASFYLIINQIRPSWWRILPLKEFCIGFLFAMGVLVPLAGDVRLSIFSAWFPFACLCFMNCVSIAFWERPLDAAQRRVSIATAFPAVGQLLLPALAVIGLTSFALASFRSFGGAYVCAATSAILLAALHLLRDKIQADVRTALADLVLLTPLVSLIAR